MNFELNEDLSMLRDMTRDFAEKEIAPHADQWDEDGYFPHDEVLKKMGELGMFGTVIEEQYGGNEMGWLAAMIITEEIARGSSALRVQVNMQELGIVGYRRTLKTWPCHSRQAGSGNADNRRVGPFIHTEK